MAMTPSDPRPSPYVPRKHDGGGYSGEIGPYITLGPTADKYAEFVKCLSYLRELHNSTSQIKMPIDLLKYVDEKVVKEQNIEREWAAKERNIEREKVINTLISQTDEYFRHCLIVSAFMIFEPTSTTGVGIMMLRRFRGEEPNEPRVMERILRSFDVPLKGNRRGPYYFHIGSGALIHCLTMEWPDRLPYIEGMAIEQLGRLGRRGLPVMEEALQVPDLPKWTAATLEASYRNTRNFYGITDKTPPVDPFV